jgi:CspA family cold shock protein
MPYRDTKVVCEACSREFIFTVEEQRKLGTGGSDVVVPSRCPGCREQVEAEAGTGPFEGTVKWFSLEKGYGFIAQRSGGEIFFHRSGIADGRPEDFVDGASVTYIIEQSHKGPAAVEVALLEGD